MNVRTVRHRLGTLYIVSNHKGDKYGSAFIITHLVRQCMSINTIKDNIKSALKACKEGWPDVV